MIILLWPGIIVYGLVSALIFISELWKMRVRGSYLLSYLFIIIWSGIMLFFLFSSYTSFLKITPYDPNIPQMLPTPMNIFENFYWALVASTFILSIHTIPLIFDLRKEPEFSQMSEAKANW